MRLGSAADVAGRGFFILFLAACCAWAAGLAMGPDFPGDGPVWVSGGLSFVLGVVRLPLLVVAWGLGRLARRPGPVTPDLGDAYRDRFPRSACPVHRAPSSSAR